MSMNELFGLAGAKPKLITRYTSAAPTGTYVPTVDNARCLVRIQGGGGGGSTGAGGAGGGGGAMAEVFIRVPIAGLAYVVGAGGAAVTAGSKSTFGEYMAMGGQSDLSSTGVGGLGGFLTILGGSANATNASTVGSNGLPGVSGGQGGFASGAGMRAGFPVTQGALVVSPIGNYYTNFANGQGNLSGGNSFYGKGGLTNASPASDAYGAGGGGGASPGAGQAGCIEIWDFGA